MTVVDSALIAAHPEGFTFAEDEVVEDGIARETITKFYRAHELKIGNLSLSDVLVASLDLGQLSEVSPNIHAMIGFNVISKANWYLDFPGKKWAVLPLLSRQ